MPQQHKTFHEILSEISENQEDRSKTPDENGLEPVDLPLLSEEDRLIVMHRDAHFGGRFPVMNEYYVEEGIGCLEEIRPKDIQYLDQLEAKIDQNLADLILGEADLERVRKAQKAYATLKEIYEVAEATKSNPRLIADLLLSESEEPEAEISEIVEKGTAIVDDLIELLRSNDFSDPLFPGYGRGPSLAADCLGRIADPRAVIPLFEALSSEGGEMEEAVLQGLSAMGKEAKEFLIKRLKSDPITSDHERAAVGLTMFREDPEVAQTCFAVLTEKMDQLPDSLLLHLILSCEALKDETLRSEFKELKKHPRIGQELQVDMEYVEKGWKID